MHFKYKQIILCKRIKITFSVSYGEKTSSRQMDMVPCYKSKAILTCSLTWSIQDSATSYGFPSNRQYFRHLKVVVENYFNIFPNTIMLYIIYRSNTILVIILKQETYEKKPIVVGNLHYIKSWFYTCSISSPGDCEFHAQGCSSGGQPLTFWKLPLPFYLHVYF